MPGVSGHEWDITILYLNINSLCFWILCATLALFISSNNKPFEIMREIWSIYFIYSIHSFIHSEHKWSVHFGDWILSSLRATLNSQCLPWPQQSRQHAEICWKRERKKWKAEKKGGKKGWSIWKQRKDREKHTKKEEKTKKCRLWSQISQLEFCLFLLTVKFQMYFNFYAPISSSVKMSQMSWHS